MMLKSGYLIPRNLHVSIAFPLIGLLITQPLIWTGSYLLCLGTAQNVLLLMLNLGRSSGILRDIWIIPSLQCGTQMGKSWQQATKTQPAGCGISGTYHSLWTCSKDGWEQ